MSNESTNGLTELEIAQRTISKLQVQLAQYRDDITGAAMDKDVITCIHLAMIKKYTEVCHDSNNMTVRLLCANVVQDCNNIIKVSTIPVATLLE